VNQQDQFFRVIQVIGEELFSGHFTIMKFTTNWRVSFGSQPQSHEDIQAMASGNTLMAAFVKALPLALAEKESEAD
jgi:hypothetical protein